MRIEIWIICVLTLGVVKCLTIDNQLTVIRNDCYERLAIGERISIKDVEKTLTLSTVQDCQMACTQEQEKCRSFSFGIGVKGNSSCELSSQVIKETADLKPIGTISDVDYDLYIKKLGCKLVLPKEPSASEKPLPYNGDKVQDKPSYPTKPSDGYTSSGDYNHNKPSYGQNTNQHDSSSSMYAPDKPYRVQSTFISIASNPNQPSNPLPPPIEKPDRYGPSRYGTGRPYYPNPFHRPDFDRPPVGYDYFDDRPPFRPVALNHPYNRYEYEHEFYPERPPFLSERYSLIDRVDSEEGYRQRPIRPNDIPERPPPGYGSKPNRPHFLPNRPNSRPDFYGEDSHRPHDVPDRPIGDPGAYGPRPHRPDVIPERPLNDEYESRPTRPHDRPVNGPGAYGSRPHRPDVIPERPVDNEYGPRPIRPQEIPERPLDLDKYAQGSNRPRPHDIPDRPIGSYGPRPHRPDVIPERPLNNEYGSRPIRPYDIPDRPVGDPDAYGPRPHRPNIIPERPLNDGYGQRPTRPHEIPERPLDLDKYDQSSNRPRPHDIPNRPLDAYGPRPHRPDNIPERPLDNEYGPRPIRPQEIPERPLDLDKYNQGSNRPRPHDIPNRPVDDPGTYAPRPHRPDIIPERPLNDGYGSRPIRPEEIPERPSNLDKYDQGSNRPRPHDIPNRPVGDSGGYGPRPHRPEHIPERPLNDGYGSRPTRPQDIPERPLDPDRYGQSSHQHRPHDIPNRPLDDPDAYGLRPHRPDIIPDRPIYEYPLRPLRPHEGENFDYGQGLRPHRPPDIPERPLGDRYGSKPHRPDIIPDRPADDDYIPQPPYGSAFRPHRPLDVLERPNGFGPHRPENEDIDRYGQEFHRPQHIPDRPSDDFDNYGRPGRPQWPHHFPERPDHNHNPDLDDSENYGPRPYRPHYGPERPFDYIGERPYFRPVVYDTGFKRPVYVPKPVYSNSNSTSDYGKGKPAEKTNTTQSSLNSKEYSNSTSNNTSAQDLKLPNEESNIIPNGTKNLNHKPIVTQSIGSYGETITSIITEIDEACFRRVLAGKRVLRSFVRRALTCERVEDCQRECNDERRFVCEGFNYRLDPAGRAQGDCELLDLPLSRLDIRRDIISDPDYDYYERDRNSNAPDCKGDRYYGSYGNSGYYSSGSSGNRYDQYDQHGGGYYHGNSYNNGKYGSYDVGKYGNGYNRQPRPGEYDDDYRYYGGNRRGDYDYHHTYQSQDDHHGSHGYHYKYYDDYGHEGHDHSSHGYHYPSPDQAQPRDNYDYKPHYPPPPYDYKSYEPYLPHGYWKYERPYHESSDNWDKYFNDRVKDKDHWGFNKHHGGWGNYGGSYGNFGAPDSYYSYDYYDYNHKNNNRKNFDSYDQRYYFTPHEYGGSKDWGQYGGSYGYGGQKRVNSHRDSYDYWDFKRLDHGSDNRGLLPPYQDRPHFGGNYLPPYEEGHDYLDIQHDGHHDYDHYGHHRHDYHDFLKDECSLRMVTGFRLHKGIVKKLIAVTNIYECEVLCHKEADFPCASYAFRYTLVPNLPSENCYLSDRNYKELDYYTDLEPDRDCDIYTINNKDRCDQPIDPGRYDSECFWRVRSGQRLDQRVVRDSLNVKSIVDCQLECLRSHRFTCRAFSFRYGSPVIGGAIDNCQLTDWPYLDLDPRLHLIPESGFELYERGSYGHGCEPNHFEIGGKPGHNPDRGKLDHVCYVGYGKPARLLPQATKKSLTVASEAECKAECTKAREKSLFQCMSLSYRTSAPKGSTNCDLSDIVQRDLLSNVDYIADPDSWLFAWDIHNPQCVAVLVVGGVIGGGTIGSGDGGTWGGGGGSTWGGGSGGSTWGSGSDGTWGNGAGHHHHGHPGYPEYPEKGNGGATIPWSNPGNPIDTWRIYSVGGLPCKRGSLCQQNTVAGFWYCELEGREEHAWDYCCRPEHQCGYSEGFPYQWCYVGPARTQWRKCSDQYYPYTNSIDDRFDYHHHHHSGSYLPDGGHSNSLSYVPEVLPPNRPSIRPDRPPSQSLYPSQPSLDEYEPQFSNHFLDPPKPGGFGQSRHWPISYLHKEMPPNDTSTTSADPKYDFVKLPKGRNIDTKYAAIANLIDVIKSNDFKEVEYQISNSSDKADDILYVKIPLPSNLTSDQKSEKLSKVNETEDVDKLQVVDLLPVNEEKTNKTNSPTIRSAKILENLSENNATSRKSHVYTRSYITKTNRTASNRRRAKSSKGTVELLPLS